MGLVPLSTSQDRACFFCSLLRDDMVRSLQPGGGLSPERTVLLLSSWTSGLQNGEKETSVVYKPPILRYSVLTA